MVLGLVKWFAAEWFAIQSCIESSCYCTDDDTSFCFKIDKLKQVNSLSEEKKSQDVYSV